MSMSKFPGFPFTGPFAKGGDKFSPRVYSHHLSKRENTKMEMFFRSLFHLKAQELVCYSAALKKGGNLSSADKPAI